MSDNTCTEYDEDMPHALTIDDMPKHSMAVTPADSGNMTHVLTVDEMPSLLAFDVADE